MQCKFIKNGKHCGAFAMNKSEFCFSHNPEAKEQKQLAVMKGGKALKRSACVQLATVDINDKKDVIPFLVAVINELRGGKIDNRKANSLAYVGGVLIKAYELAEMEDRLEKVERLVLEKRTYK
jgi:hypothetical protein